MSNVYQLRLLRVSVGVNNIYSKYDFLDSRFQQVNLRHLDFRVRYYGLSYLIPSSISLLWNLQSLVFSNNGVETSMPYEIWEMTQLRHLEFDGSCPLPDPVPQQESVVLRNLHTLLVVSNLRLTEEVCKRMPNLKKLSVYYRDSLDDGKLSSYCLHNFDLFKKLETLWISFHYDSKVRDDARSLRLPSSVEELHLYYCPFDWEDLNRMTGDLPHLRYLSLREVQGLEWNVLDDQFPSLNVLQINACDDLIYWNANSSQFPVLEELQFDLVPILSEIPFDIGEIPTFRSIQVRHCNVFVAVSALRILVEQESLGNEDLQLNVHFNERGEVERFQKILQEEGLRSNSLKISFLKF